LANKLLIYDSSSLYFTATIDKYLVKATLTRHNGFRRVRLFYESSWKVSRRTSLLIDKLRFIAKETTPANRTLIICDKFNLLLPLEIAEKHGCGKVKEVM